MAATSEQRSTVVGVFEDRHQADTARSWAGRASGSAGQE